MDYNKKVATDLYVELQDLLRGIPDQISAATNDGPVIKIICEGLGKAIDAIKTVV